MVKYLILVLFFFIVSCTPEYNYGYVIEKAHTREHVANGQTVPESYTLILHTDNNHRLPAKTTKHIYETVMGSQLVKYKTTNDGFEVVSIENEFYKR